ncbi:MULTISPECIES: hypothetical protein [unclassified Sporosarcina]|nr:MULTISPECIES: hypothetical protein [unclassified Sporosarcina]
MNVSKARELISFTDQHVMKRDQKRMRSSGRIQPMEEDGRVKRLTN